MGGWGVDKERDLSILPLHKKNNKKNPGCFNPTADSSLSCSSPAKKKSKQQQSGSEDYSPLGVFTLHESCHSHLSIAIHPRYRSHLPPHNAPPLCAELEPLCWQTSGRPYPDLPSLCFHALREIHFSSFIWALAHISISCLSFVCLMQPNGINEADARPPHKHRTAACCSSMFERVRLVRWRRLLRSCFCESSTQGGSSPSAAAAPDGGCGVFGVKRRAGAPSQQLRGCWCFLERRQMFREKVTPGGRGRRTEWESSVGPSSFRL